MNMFACLCGARHEQLETEPPKCWACGAVMYFWKVRECR